MKNSIVIILILLLCLTSCADLDSKMCTLANIQDDKSTDFNLLETRAGGAVTALFLEDTRVYLGVGNTFLILDMTDPSNPQPIGHKLLHIPILSIQVIGDYAYININEPLTESTIVDISISDNPVEVKCQEDVFLRLGNAVIYEGHAYFPSLDDGNLYVYDISDSNRIKEVAIYEPTNFKRFRFLPYPRIEDVQQAVVTDVTVVDSYLYVAENMQVPGEIYLDNGRIQIFDISNPAKLRSVGVFRLPSVANVIQLEHYENYLIVSSNTYGSVQTPFSTIVLDISNPFEPVEVNRFNALEDLITLNQAYAYFLYVNNGAAAIRVRDISEPSKVVTSEWSRQNFRLVPHLIHNVEIDDNFAYLADGYLHVLDVTNPFDPVKVSVMEYATLANIQEISVVNDMVYIGHDINGFRIVDISNLDRSITLSAIDYPTDDVAISGDYVYLISVDLGLKILDVSNPENPITLIDMVTPDFHPKSLALYDNIMYLLDSRNGVKILDISDPNSIIQLGHYQTNVEKYNDIAVTEQYLYVTVWEGGKGELKVINISNPEEPFEVGSYESRDELMNIVVNTRLAYTTTGTTLRAFNILDPTKPTEISSYQLPSDASGLFADGKQIYVGLSNGGLILLEYDPPLEAR